jgi:RND family efflux transporter MFP subunit
MAFPIRTSTSPDDGETKLLGFMRNRSITLLLACSAGLLQLTGCTKPKEAAVADSGPKVIPITVKPLERKSIERKIDVVGSLKGWEEFQLGAKKGGRVLKIHHDIGDRVKPGEVIIEIDPVDSMLSVVQAERNMQAELAQIGLKQLPSNPSAFDVDTVPSVVRAKVELERAMQNLTRQRAISQRNAGSLQELQNSESDFKSAEAGLEAARVQSSAILAGARVAAAALDVAQQNLKDLNILAPQPKTLPPNGLAFQYAISKRMVSEGQYIRDGEPIAELVIEDTLKYVAKVPERYSNQVVLGQELTLRVASFEDRTFTGKLTRVNPTVDPISRTFQVEATIPNPKNELRPGGFAKADILIDRKGSGVVVPIEAVVRTVGVTKIFLVVDDEKSSSKKTAREIQVTAGTEGAGWMEIIGKLPATGEVVTSGQSQLADGTPVRIKTPEEADDAGTSNSVNASAPKVDAAKTAPVAK